MGSGSFGAYLRGGPSIWEMKDRKVRVEGPDRMAKPRDCGLSVLSCGGGED